MRTRAKQKLGLNDAGGFSTEGQDVSNVPEGARDRPPRQPQFAEAFRCLGRPTAHAQNFCGCPLRCPELFGAPKAVGPPILKLAIEAQDHRGLQCEPSLHACIELRFLISGPAHRRSSCTALAGVQFPAAQRRRGKPSVRGPRPTRTGLPGFLPETAPVADMWANGSSPRGSILGRLGAGRCWAETPEIRLLSSSSSRRPPPARAAEQSTAAGRHADWSRECPFYIINKLHRPLRLHRVAL
ncbi:hypothetical protein HPB47_026691 [Ixodes persulcatus]|uniref:Uncharacterized protein n=1 Tax=Ixodes persulcatus TaxID=34615 RepID=A0AC60PZI4_IXOPE|nr:hypothetical protein HPB47_026691 [Ixodes persulcatus]